MVMSINLCCSEYTGVAFASKEDLDNHLVKIEEADKRNHRKLGKELDLFSIHEEVGPGLILWHPKGAIIRRAIEDFWKDEHINRGYDIVYTRTLTKVDLWKTSGHWEFTTTIVQPDGGRRAGIYP